MEVSSDFKEITINQVKPTIDEIWLWKDYRDFKFMGSVEGHPKFKEE